MRSFTNDGLTFDVDDSGPPDGPAVVLLHGFPQNRHSWDEVAPLLTERGYRTLAVDQRGYSPGARPRGRRSYTAPRLVGDVVALLDAAGVDRAHVVGHDWGGGVAWAMAQQRPDRLHTMTSLSTPHPQALLRALAGRQALHSWYMLAFQLPVLPELVVNRAARTGLPGLPDAVVDRYREQWRDRRTATAMLNWYRALPFTKPAQAAQPVDVPVLYVWSTEDAYLGRRAAELTADYVRGPYRFEVLDGVSHWLPELVPVQVAALIDEHIRANS